MYRQAPYTIASTSQEPSAATSVPALAAGVECDAPSLIEDEDYYPTQIVKSKAWDSLSEHYRQLQKLEAPLIEKVPDDDDLDAEGKDKDGSKAPLILTVQQQHMNLTGRMACQFGFADEEATIQFYADAVHQLRTADSVPRARQRPRARRSCSGSSRLNALVFICICTFQTT